MKSDILLDAIGMISDEYVQDAKSVRVVKKSHPWLKWSAMAACACILVYLGLQSGFGGSYSEGTATNDASSNISAESAQNAGSSGNASSDSAPNAVDGTETGGSPELESGEANQSSYPYDDKLVLDYVGMELEDMITDEGTIVFNEITDIEMYRELNNLSEDTEEAYYDTRNSLYQYLLGEEDTKYFLNREEGGLVPGKTGNEAYIEASKPDDSPEEWVYISQYLLEETCLGNSVEGAISDSLETVALKTYVADSPNGQVTVLVSKDLDALGAEVQAFVAPMRETLGTEQSSLISGQEVVVQHFYQQRMFREEALEECYQYYAYFEKDGVQYLYQYSSNWTLPGEAVTAIHNPPHTISEALAQEESREMFAGLLVPIVHLATAGE